MDFIAPLSSCQIQYKIEKYKSHVHNKQVGRKLITLFLSFLVLLFIPGISFTQEEPASSGVAVPDIYPIPPNEPGFLGQDHSYSVTFRGNGEAVVALKVALTNKGETPLSEVKLRVPRISPQEFFVYQVIKEPSCIRYLTDSACAEYQEPDYYGYWWSKTRYQKAQSEFEEDTLTITLPQAVSADKTGSYLVYFRAMGYAQKNIFGAYKFTFETIKVEDDIRNLTLGISTDSDLVLRGATGEVNYRFEDAGVALKGVGGAPAESSAIDTFYNQIGYGSLVKTASSLAPLESYSVSSSFADTRIKLYAKEILIGVGIFLGILAMVLIVARIILKRQSARAQGAQAPSFDTKNLFLSLGISFASASFITGYTILAILAATYLIRSVGYDLQAVVTIFVVIISFAVYALLLFAPGIYLGAKKSVGWGIATIILTVVWMFLFLGAGLLIYLAVRIPNVYPGPIIPLQRESLQY